MKSRWLLISLFLFFATVAEAQDHEIKNIVFVPPVQACDVGAATTATNGSRILYLPLDVPDPACIAEAGMSNEYVWPAGVDSPLGPWFIGLDPSSDFVSCSGFPNAQECPRPDDVAREFARLRTLVIMAVEESKKAQIAINHHNPPICYRKGDVLVFVTSCRVPQGSSGQVQPTATVGVIFPRQTKTSTCDTYTKLSLHGGQFDNPDGTPNPNFISDSSPSWHQMTSTATIDTSQSVFGGSSVHFDGTPGTYIVAQPSSNWRFGRYDWTVEMRWHPGHVNAGVFQQLLTNGSFGPISLGQYGASFAFSSSSNGSTWNVAAAVSFGSAVVGQWTHLVVQRQGNSILLSQDGALKATVPVSGSLFDPSQALLVLGNNNISAGSYPATGYMDEVRISKEIARFPGGNYTVPAAAYCE